MAVYDFLDGFTSTQSQSDYNVILVQISLCNYYYNSISPPNYYYSYTPHHYNYYF